MNRLLGSLVRVAVSSAVGGRRGYGNNPYRRRRGTGSSLLLIALALGAGYMAWKKESASNSLDANQYGTMIGRVERVVDGDTFYLQGHSIRVWGINAPERDEPGYHEATRALQTLLNRRILSCTPVGTSYNRIVAACTADNRIDVSAMMVKGGWARDYPSKSGGRFAALEAEAKAAHRGVWR